jgi:hypothetical protein
VNDIHKRGGTILGTSRGGHDTSKIVDSIQDRGINQVGGRHNLLANLSLARSYSPFQRTKIYPQFSHQPGLYYRRRWNSERGIGDI